MRNISIILLILVSWFHAVSQNSIDQLQYNYSPNTNQLKYIADAIGATASTADLDDQNRSNYTYNNIGQLTQDKAEGILDIAWTASGKVKEVSIDDDSNLVADRTLKFQYDGMGNRIKKIETFLTTGSPQLTTFYLRNVVGELISIYENDGSITERVESNIKGVGTDNTEENTPLSGVYARKIGDKNYELKDHIGNVRVTVSDTKEPNLGLTTFNSQLTTSADYYAFGMEMSGRTTSSAEGHRYGYQRKEKDDELKGNGNSYDFGARILDSRVGRWVSPDHLESQFPSVSPYVSMGNNPINRIDIDGNADKAVCYSEVSSELRPFYESMDKKSWEKMIQFYKANAALSLYSDDRQNCVTSFNSGVDKLFDESMGLQIDDSRVNRSAGMLGQKGLASDPVIINYKNRNGKVAPGFYAQPTEMAGSLAREALEMTGCLPGYHVFALSMMDGYHTMTLSVVIAGNEVGYVLSDHVKKPYGGTGGMLLFDSAADLDRWITEYTLEHSSYTGKIHTTIWKLYNPDAGLFSSDPESQECEDNPWDDEYEQSSTDESEE